eukprot:m.252864 g.252864  ORF g.252864 m.252864 type:complete len:377 (+) comp18000_c0_seq1:66-1196(+)
MSKMESVKSGGGPMSPPSDDRESDRSASVSRTSDSSVASAPPMFLSEALTKLRDDIASLSSAYVIFNPKFGVVSSRQGPLPWTYSDGTFTAHAKKLCVMMRTAIVSLNTELEEFLSSFVVEVLKFCIKYPEQGKNLANPAQLLLKVLKESAKLVDRLPSLIFSSNGTAVYEEGLKWCFDYVHRDLNPTAESVFKCFSSMFGQNASKPDVFKETFKTVLLEMSDTLEFTIYWKDKSSPSAKFPTCKFKDGKGFVLCSRLYYGMRCVFAHGNPKISLETTFPKAEDMKDDYFTEPLAAAYFRNLIKNVRSYYGAEDGVWINYKDYLAYRNFVEIFGVVCQRTAQKVLNPAGHSFIPKIDLSENAADEPPRARASAAVL